MAQESHHSLSDQHAEAYSQLCDTYEQRITLLKDVRQVILQRILRDLPDDSTILDVGCGNGGNLALMRALGYQATGIEVSAQMAAAARRNSHCDVREGDFFTTEFSEPYTVVFAQAFVHLFPKQELPQVLACLARHASHRVYFSTTLETLPGEGFESKEGIALRYRSRYTAAELHQVLDVLTAAPTWKCETFELTDPLGKLWLNVMLTRWSRATSRGA